MARSHAPGNQERMLDYIHESGTFQVRDFDQPLPPEPGASQDLAERNERLQSALKNIGLANQRAGFVHASETGQLQDINRDRYGEAAPQVVSGASRNKEYYLDEAKRDFWAAGGYLALVGSGMLNIEDAKDIARRDFYDFTLKYASPDNRHARDQYRKKLARNSKNL